MHILEFWLMNHNLHQLLLQQNPESLRLWSWLTKAKAVLATGCS